MAVLEYLEFDLIIFRNDNLALEEKKPGFVVNGVVLWMKALTKLIENWFV